MTKIHKCLFQHYCNSHTKNQSMLGFISPNIHELAFCYNCSKSVCFCVTAHLAHPQEKKTIQNVGQNSTPFLHQKKKPIIWEIHVCLLFVLTYFILHTTGIALLGVSVVCLNGCFSKFVCRTPSSDQFLPFIWGSKVIFKLVLVCTNWSS